MPDSFERFEDFGALLLLLVPLLRKLFSRWLEPSEEHVPAERATTDSSGRRQPGKKPSSTASVARVPSDLLPPRVTSLAAAWEDSSDDGQAEVPPLAAPAQRRSLAPPPADQMLDSERNPRVLRATEKELRPRGGTTRPRISRERLQRALVWQAALGPRRLRSQRSPRPGVETE